jgi:O-antigen/teichoic acid export membrane protein
MRNTVSNLLRKTLLSSTGKNSLVTMTAIAINTGFSAAFFIILARMLGPADFGLFSVALALMVTITGIVDVGTNYGILRFTSRSPSYLKLGLYTKIVLGLMGTAVVAIFGNFLAIQVLHQPKLGPIFIVSSLGVIGGLLYGYGLNAAQSLQRFFVWSFLQIAPSAIRLALLLLLAVLGILSPQTAMLAYTSMLFAVFLGVIPFLPKKLLSFSITSEHLRNFFSYNRWMALYSIILVAAGNMDRFFLARFTTPSEVGFYVAATQIAAVGIQVNAALATVLIPKFAATHDFSAISKFMKKAIILTFTLALGGVVISFLAKPLTQIIFGLSYAPSVTPLRILILSVAFALASLPFTSFWLYWVGDSKLFALYYLFNGSVMFIANWMLVPLYGAVGSAIASLLGNALTLTVSAIYVLSYRRLKSSN